MIEGVLKVYIVQGRVTHEGAKVLGVFFTEESANYRLDELQLDANMFDSFEVEAWEVET